MFFILGISKGERKLNFVQTFVCSACGKFGRFEAYMTYTYFTLFFIPLFRWNTEYYVVSSCCGTVYSIDKALGKRIQKGEEIHLNDNDLLKVGSPFKRSEALGCPSCGYPVSKDFEFCPKCGRKL